MKRIFVFVLFLSLSTFVFAATDEIEQIPPGTFFCKGFSMNYSKQDMLKKFCRKDLPFSMSTNYPICCTKIGVSPHSDLIHQLQKFTNEDLETELRRRNSK